MLRALSVTLLGVALVAESAGAQAPEVAAPQLAPGQRVRITSATYRLHNQIGTVIAVAGDTITAQVPTIQPVKHGRVTATDTLVMSHEAIDRLEVSRDHGSRTGRGALIGMLSGAMLGGVVGAATYQECTPEGFFGLNCLMAPESAAEQAQLGALAGGLIGAGIGAIVGAATHWDRWEEVPRRNAGVSVRALPQGGVGLGVALRF